MTGLLNCRVKKWNCTCHRSKLFYLLACTTYSIKDKIGIFLLVMAILFSISIYIYIYIYGYHHRTWTWQLEFKSWKKSSAFHKTLIPLKKVQIKLFFFQL